MNRREHKRLREHQGAYTGPVAYMDEIDGKPIMRSFYMLTEDGKGPVLPLIRMVSVDDAPGDPEDGSCHYEVAREDDRETRPGNIVDLETRAEGRTRMEA